MKLRPWRVLVLLLALLPSVGCATRYTVSEQDVQREIDRFLPVALEQRVSGAPLTALVRVERLALRLPDNPGGRLRLAGEGTLDTRYGEFALSQPLSAELSGRLRYDAESKQILLADAQLASLDVPMLAQVLPRDVYQSLVAEASRALVVALSKQPLYTLSDRNTAESLFRRLGTAIETRDRRIIFTLD